MSRGALPGFRDFYPEQMAERNHITNAWREIARRYAFVEYDGPPLEPLDLYTKKSGEEIVGQLYNFQDKGERQVALRPEMTPTLARMVAERANALRKPVRWFSIPQLFRYERQQKGRLREHFQLNVDIIGESSPAADAELLASAVDIMRELGLTSKDVVARVSDRRLLQAILLASGVTEEYLPAVYAVIDKLGREPENISREKLAKICSEAVADRILERITGHKLQSLDDFTGLAADEQIAPLREYFAALEALGVADWVTLDLGIVRGLAYYTGIVFELFDRQGDFRAICGGGRYDNLLKELGGVDMPALGFGMGDVVLGELLRARGLMKDVKPVIDYWIMGEDEAPGPGVLKKATELRAQGFSVEYALKAQSLKAQWKAAGAAGAKKVVIINKDGTMSDVNSTKDLIKNG
ncbi:MAG: histidine--tRNA ligase [Gemmatimonadaceae bacterium]|nr:histidine--tRNA ligase [Gemmatimonadaceae bacterium]